jgi:class 3 adenylate cyclase
MEQKTQAKILRDQLENANGQPEHVVAVNLDIRGFSSFCERNESPNVVIFIREVYKRLVDRYFPKAPFIKPTGDGLLIITPYTREMLKKIASQTLHACLQVHEAFPSLCADDPMINFRVPGKIGIGLSRGLVSRIMANGTTLDYSGRVLNLASRLMNTARPSGIVFDCDYLTGLTPPPDLEKTFSKDEVWLWGIAESDPIEVYYSKAFGTDIPAIYKRRLDMGNWTTEKGVMLFRNLEILTQRNLRPVFKLDYEPRDPEEIIVEVLYPRDIKSKIGGRAYYLPRELFSYTFEGGEARLHLNAELLLPILRDLGFLSKHKCEFEFRYSR